MFNPISVQISINDYQSFAKLLVGFAEELKGGWIINKIFGQSDLIVGSTRLKYDPEII